MKIAAIAHCADALSLAGVPGLDVIAETTDESSLHRAGQSLCDVVICDLDQAEPHEVKAVINFFPSTPVVALISEHTPAFRVVDAQSFGCKEFIRKPFDAKNVAIALQSVVVQGGSRGKSICLIGASGGAGVTTIACNLAVALAPKGRVGLIDADLSFGNVAQYFDRTPQYTIANVCSCDHIDQVSLKAAMIETEHGVSILARPNEISERSKVTPGKAAGLMHAASRTFNFIVVDLFRQLDERVGSFMLRSDLVLIVTEMNVSSANNARRIRDALVKEGFDTRCVAPVLNRVSKRSAHALTPPDVEKVLGPIFATIPNDFPAALSASDRGQPIEPHSPIAKAIQRMAESIAGSKTDEPRTGARLMRLLKGAAS
ncbi:MAG: AAA family ATPase [Phycisphaerales bacterium]|nr:MAG: AAA family ATPase [Phycisphaerales bacterium]